MKKIIKKFLAELLSDDFANVNLNDKQLKDSIDILSCEIKDYKNAITSEMETYSEQLHDAMILLTSYKEIIDKQKEQILLLKEELGFTNKKFEGYTERFNHYSENLRNNNLEMQQQRKYFSDYSINLKNNNDIMQSQQAAFKSYSINLKNNNQLIDQFLERISNESKRMDTFERSLISLQKRVQSNFEYKNTPIIDSTEKGITEKHGASREYYTIDYLDFENHFRGPRSEIMENQKQYISYFKGKSKVIDLGCGRGEFLELLMAEGIPAIGVDFYEDFVLYCNAIGLNAVVDDALHYLRGIEYTDGIFVGQVVEHLTVDQILELCDLAYQRLTSDSYIIIETPNPTSLAIYTNAFYIDPSHVKPVHPLTLEYCLRKNGFRNINLLYTDSSKLEPIPMLKCSNIENCDEFNEALKRVSKILFGSQDYAIIARKE